MALTKNSILLGLIILVTLLVHTEQRPNFLLKTDNQKKIDNHDSFNRNSFPEGFMFGTAASSYQFEGAVTEDGRGPSIWDEFTHSYPERNNMENADVSVDFYHRYKDDIKLMKDMNMDTFRFSISWSRILPNGTISGGINQKGIQFYKNLIDELLANGLQPFVTIFHWDLPLALDKKYGGFLSPRIVDDFIDYARLCFNEFGDKVRFWSTFNEPWVYSVAGYDNGKKALGRCSKWVNSACQAGNSAIEPYNVTHHMLLAHAATVNELRNCVTCHKNSEIGIVLSPAWFEPHTHDSIADKNAVKIGLDFMLGWHLDPIIFGDYPQTMKDFVGDRLPTFTKEQSESLKNSFDFIGINYYGALYISPLENVDPEKPRYTTDQHVEWKKERNGIPIGPQAASDNILVYPEGLKYLLKYIKDNYNNPPIYITENGYDDYNNETMSLEEALNDTPRKEYHEMHLKYLLEAINEYGVNVKGYIVWSLMDNFEWNLGYSVRFGLYYVDFTDGLKRYPKESAKWFTEFLKRRTKESNLFSWIPLILSKVTKTLLLITKY